MDITKEFITEIKGTLERCLIILEDNPKIKDVSEFYTGEDLVGEIGSILHDLKGVK